MENYLDIRVFEKPISFQNLTKVMKLVSSTHDQLQNPTFDADKNRLITTTDQVGLHSFLFE